MSAWLCASRTWRGVVGADEYIDGTDICVLAILGMAAMTKSGGPAQERQDAVIGREVVQIGTLRRPCVAASDA